MAKLSKRAQYKLAIRKIVMQDKPLEEVCREYDEFKRMQTILKLNKKQLSPRYWDDELKRELVYREYKRFVDMPLKPKALVFYEYLFRRHMNKLLEWYNHSSGRGLMEPSANNAMNAAIERQFAVLNPEMDRLNHLLASFLCLRGFPEMQDTMRRQLEQTFDKLCAEYKCDQFELLLMMPVIQRKKKKKSAIIIMAKSEHKLGWIYCGSPEDIKSMPKEVRKCLEGDDQKRKSNARSASKCSSRQTAIKSTAAANVQKKPAKTDTTNVKKTRAEMMTTTSICQSSENSTADNADITLW